MKHLQLYIKFTCLEMYCPDDSDTTDTGNSDTTDKGDSDTTDTGNSDTTDTDDSDTTNIGTNCIRSIERANSYQTS